jgi:hypothetical protein
VTDLKAIAPEIATMVVKPHQGIVHKKARQEADR